MNECMFASAMYVNDYASYHVLCSSILVLYMSMFMGQFARMVNVLVASSSPVEGSGTSQLELQYLCYPVLSLCRILSPIFL